MFGTPDFGHSDLWHFHFALKFFLSESLKKGYLPFWSKDVGMGFPVLAEGQIGMFNLYNLLAFRFLDPVVAFNLGYLVIFLTTIAGTYLFCRTINLSKSVSLLAGIVFSLSGVFVTHIPHFNYVQACSFLPWMFFLTEKFLLTQKKRFGLFLAMVISQQIFAGYPQMVFISLVGLGLYSFLRLLQLKRIKQGIFLFFWIGIGAIIGLPQLLVTWQLVKESPPLSSSTYALFPYNPIHLFSFIYPYLFGDPRVGTYAPYGSDWGLFWESTGYFGGLGFVLGFGSLFIKKKNNYEKVFWIVAVVALVLFLGKYSPFYFVHQIPPFSFFRVPARFIFLFSWAMVILFANCANRLQHKKILFRTIFAFAVFESVLFASTYNPIINSKKWLAEPETVKFLKEIDNRWYRVHAISASTQWNESFMASGWKNMEPFFSLRNSLEPNENLFWNIPSADHYSRLVPKRHALWRLIIDQETAQTNDSFALSPVAESLLTSAGVKYVISPKELKGEAQRDFLLIKKFGLPEQFFIYQNQKVLPHAYLTNDFVVKKGLNSLVRNFPVGRVFLEEEVGLRPDQNPSGEVNILRDSDLEVDLRVNALRESLLILSDSYYPGWKALVDGVETRIYPANINQRAIIVGPGEHEVLFSYEPFQFLDKK